MRRLFLILASVLVIATVAVAQTPPPPTNLVAERIGIGGVMTVQLTWEAPTGVQLFNVYQSFGDTNGFAQLDRVTDTSYLDFTALMSGTFYYYVTSVVVRPDSQMLESGRSNIASVTIGGSVTPPAPTNLVAQLQPSGMPLVRLDWESSEIVDYFRIYKAVDDSSNFTLYALSSVTVFFDNDLAHGTRNFYYVTAVVDPGGSVLESERSNIASIARAGGAFGTVSGTIVDDSTSAPIPGISVKFFSANNPTAIVYSSTTNFLGQYSATLDTGTYKIFADSPEPFPGIPGQYRSEWFDDREDFLTADPASVAESSHVVANFGLSSTVISSGPIGVVRGTVVDDSTQQPIAFILIGVFDASDSTQLRSIALTDGNGRYEAIVDTGLCKVYANTSSIPGVWDSLSYRPEWFDNVLTFEAATSVHVQHGDSVTANFALSLLNGSLPPTNLVGNLQILPQPAVRLTWAVSVMASTYRVYRSIGTGQPFILFGQTSDLSLVDTQIAQGDTNRYYVTSVRIQGSIPIESQPSNAVIIPIQVGPTGVAGHQTVPANFQLYQNYPNPFNPTTSIRFDLPEDSKVTLRVFDILGREVITLANGQFAAGGMSVVWDGRDTHGNHVTSGVYLYRFTAEGIFGRSLYAHTGKMVLLK